MVSRVAPARPGEGLGNHKPKRTMRRRRHARFSWARTDGGRPPGPDRTGRPCGSGSGSAMLTSSSASDWWLPIASSWWSRWSFSLGHIYGAGPVVVVGLTMAADSCLLAFSGRRLRGQWLLCFPLLLVASELACPSSSRLAKRPSSPAFFTLMFVFIGLTQRRGDRTSLHLGRWSGLGGFIERPWTGEVASQVRPGARRLVAHFGGPCRSDRSNAGPDEAPCHHREHGRTDGTRKSPLPLGLHRAPGAEGRCPQFDVALHRPRRVQDGKRCVWPCRRRRASGGRGETNRVHPALRRHRSETRR